MIITLDKKKMKTVEKFAFEIGSNIDSFEIEFQKDGVNVLDLGLEKDGQFIGWTGGAKSKIKIAQHGSTDGYKQTKVTGNWNLLIGFHKIIDDQKQVEFKITKNEMKLQWLKGNTHMHTTHSDGKVTVSEIKELAIKNNLDFLCFTDHNNTSQNYEIQNGDENLVLIPGFELTTYNGHANFLGMTEPLNNIDIIPSRTDLNQLMQEASENGALVTLNHPFCEGCGWKCEFTDYDIFEVWNEPWFKNNSRKNDAAIEWLKQQISELKTPKLVAGSDFHKFFDQTNSFINPTTICYANSKSQSGILEALKQGRSYMQNLEYDLEFKTNGYELEGNLVVDELQVLISSKSNLIIEVIKSSGVAKYETNLFDEVIKLKKDELCCIFVKDEVSLEGVLLTNIFRGK